MKTKSALISILSLLVALAPAACGDDDVTTSDGGSGGTSGSGGAQTGPVTSSVSVGGSGGEMNVAPAPPSALVLALTAQPFGVSANWQASPDVVAGYLLVRSGAEFSAADQPVDGQIYTPGATLPGGASVVANGTALNAVDVDAPLSKTAHYFVFAVSDAGLYSPPASAQIDVGFPVQDGAIQISNIAASPVVTINQQPANTQLAGTATFDAGTNTVTLSLSITNQADRMLYSPKVAIDMLNLGAATSDGTTVDGRVAAYYGPTGLAVGAAASRDIVITGVDGSIDVALDIEVLNNPMIIANGSATVGLLNMVDVSGATDAAGAAFGGQTTHALGWDVGKETIGGLTSGVFSPNGEMHYSGWKNRPVVVTMDMSTLQATASTSLANVGDYGMTSNVVISGDGASLYTLVTTGAHRFTGGATGYNGFSSVDLVQLDRSTMMELGRISLITDGPMHADLRPTKGNHVAISADGSKLVAVIEPSQLWIIDTATFTVVDADNGQAGDQPVDLSGVSLRARLGTVNLDGTTAYVGFHNNNLGNMPVDSVAVVDLANFAVTTMSSSGSAAPVGPGWAALTFGPNNQLFIGRNYAQTQGDVSLSVFDPGNSSYDDVVNTLQVMSVLFDPSGDNFYVLQRNAGAVNENGSILTYKLSDYTLVDIDGDNSNGQTNLPAAGVSTESAHGADITPF